jgi:hypothetical protein
MERCLSTVLLLGLLTACGGAGDTVSDQPTSMATELGSGPASAQVAVSVRLCEEVSAESLEGAIDAGFEPLLDDGDAVVAIGPIVSGMIAEDSLQALESAPCVESVERSDERIMIPTVSQ